MGVTTAWPNKTARTARTNSPDSTCLPLAAKSATTPLPRHAPDRRHQLLNLVPLLDHVARGECSRDAVRDVITQDLFLDLVKRRADGIDLSQNVHAVAILINHPDQAA